MQNRTRLKGLAGVPKSPNSPVARGCALPEAERRAGVKRAWLGRSSWMRRKVESEGEVPGLRLGFWGGGLRSERLRAEIRSGVPEIQILGNWCPVGSAKSEPWWPKGGNPAGPE